VLRRGAPKRVTVSNIDRLAGLYHPAPEVLDGVKSSSRTPSSDGIALASEPGGAESQGRLLVRTAGWQAAVFDSAQAFLAHPRIFAPSCLILDVNLPDLNGLDLQKRVTAERTDMPIIFISGYGDVPIRCRR